MTTGIASIAGREGQGETTSTMSIANFKLFTIYLKPIYQHPLLLNLSLIEQTMGYRLEHDRENLSAIVFKE
jgi:hypothetical protein